MKAGNSASSHFIPFPLRMYSLALVRFFTQFIPLHFNPVLQQSFHCLTAFIRLTTQSGAGRNPLLS